jgi:hypothetical protein
MDPKWTQALKPNNQSSIVILENLNPFLKILILNSPIECIGNKFTDSP